jgi:hypothetical protein
LTHGKIIGTIVPIHYHEDVHVGFNYVLDYNDQNDTFINKFISVCTLEVYNTKSCIYSQF